MPENTTPKQCSACIGVLEKGLLTGDSQHWIPHKSISGKMSKMFNFGINMPSVWAYHCPQCKKIEFYTE